MTSRICSRNGIYGLPNVTDKFADTLVREARDADTWWPRGETCSEVPKQTPSMIRHFSFLELAFSRQLLGPACVRSWCSSPVAKSCAASIPLPCGDRSRGVSMAAEFAFPELLEDLWQRSPRSLLDDGAFQDAIRLVSSHRPSWRPIFFGHVIFWHFPRGDLRHTRIFGVLHTLDGIGFERVSLPDYSSAFRIRVGQVRYS